MAFAKTTFCTNCQCEREVSLHLQICASGAEMFVWVCDTCNLRNPAGDKQYFIPRETVAKHLTDEQIEALPVIMPEGNGARCVRCGRRGAELHHWAPKRIFGVKESWQWPTDYLCKMCHDAWHKLVTPELKK